MIGAGLRLPGSERSPLPAPDPRSRETARAVDERSRHEVFTGLSRVHGESIAALILEMLPPAGVPDRATKADVEIIRGEMGTVEARLGEHIEQALREQTTRYLRWLFALAALTLTAIGIAANVAIRLAG